MKHPILTSALAAAALILTGVAAPAHVAPAAELRIDAPLDSALDEMRIGRYWHAARILRDAGADQGGPQQVMLLARADAGWKNWPGVRKLLDGASWLDEADGGEGWRLLGLAQQDAKRWDPAAQAYRAFLRVTGGVGPHAVAVGARLARVSAAAGDTAAALAALDALPPSAEPVRSWAALELARDATAAGDTATVLRLLTRVTDAVARPEAWALVPRARLAAGDSAGAEAAWRAVADQETGRRGAEAAVAAGRLTLARGDTADARTLLRAGLDEAPLTARGRAAAALLDMGGTDLEGTLHLAEILDRVGDGGAALRAYDRARSQATGKGLQLSDGHRLARARLMATVRSRQDEALEEFRSIRAGEPDDRVGPRNLEVWMAMRRRQGRDAEVRVLRRWLLEEYPASSQATEARWDEASSAESRGDLTAASAGYAALAKAAPTRSRAGQARMRVGQIALGRGRAQEAAKIFEAYLKDFPSGRRWEEASYWAARTRLELGDSAAARAHIARVRTEEPFSYYAVLGADLLDQPFDVDVPDGDAATEPAWLTAGLARMDDLSEAGLDDGADAEEARLVAHAQDSDAARLSLAEGLIHRGRTIAGINLGWELRADGAPWTRRLLRVVYPFPYRQMVVREAAEWGVDPIMLAAIIRQESAFKADIRSGAGAVGLMQVMPPTGRELARAHGPENFQEESLTTPEVNLHLGAAFFVEMNRRYKGDLPLVLSAYNAGPTRATRWRRYPEASDAERFTERIPFDETRGYVKNVRRNLGVYQALYGQD